MVLNYSLKLLGVTPDQKGMTQIEGDLIFVVMFGFSISLIMLILGRAGSFQYLSAGAEHSFVGVSCSRVRQKVIITYYLSLM